MISIRFLFCIRTSLVLLTVIFLVNCSHEEAPSMKGEYNGFQYEVDIMGTADIIGYTGTETTLSIPARIAGRPVDEIFVPGGYSDTNGVFENKNLTSVTLPYTLHYIGFRSFAVNELTEIQFPDKLNRIRVSAFMNNRLTKVVLPNSLYGLGLEFQAFKNNQITDLTIGSGVTRIESETFRNNKIGSLTIPPNITYIGRQAFADNEITELYLPEDIGIARLAFENNKLTSLSIPAGCKIESSAFTGNSITNITVGENVKLYIYPDWPVFELGFDEFYINNDEQSGTYIYENNEWTFTTSEN